jgi:hypothetical protein
MFQVKIGTLTIVARSPKEAVRIHSQVLDYDGAADVTITDMNGYPLNVEDVIRQSEEYDRH